MAIGGFVVLKVADTRNDRFSGGDGDPPLRASGVFWDNGNDGWVGDGRNRLSISDFEFA